MTTVDEARAALWLALQQGKDGLAEVDALIAAVRAEAEAPWRAEAEYQHRLRAESAQELAALREAVEREPMYDPADRITAMSGEVREPRTPADYVEAYRSRVLRALAATPAETFWLVERGQAEGQEPPMWWTTHARQWTADVSLAARFTTKAAAEHVLIANPGLVARATEHSYLAATPARVEAADAP